MSWFKGSAGKDKDNDKDEGKKPVSSPWFRGTPDSDTETRPSWNKVRDRLEKGQLRTEVVNEPPAGIDNTTEDGNVVRLQKQEASRNRAAVAVATPDNVTSEHIMAPLLEAGPLREVDLTVEDSFRLAEQFIRDGRVGRCIRVHLQDSQTRKIEILADSDLIKVLVQLSGVFAMSFHILVSDTEQSVHIVALLTAIVFVIFTGIKLAAFGFYYLRAKPWQRMEVLLVTTHLVIVAVKFGEHNNGSDINSGWYQLMLPAILICWSRTMRHTLSVVTRTFMASFFAISFMCLVLMMIGYYGFILFQDTYTDAYQGTVAEDRYDNLFYAFVSTFTLFTTENYPSIQVTAYQKHHWALLYFMPIIFLTIILQAVVLARVDATFTQTLLNKTRYHFSKELRGYAFAFLAITLPEQAQRNKLLDHHREHSPIASPLHTTAAEPAPAECNARSSATTSAAASPVERGAVAEDREPTISADQWLRLVQFFTASEEKAKAFAEVTFFFRDDDASGDISLIEFLGLAELLKFEITEEMDMLKSRSLRRPGLEFFRGLTESSTFVTLSTINILSSSMFFISPSLSTGSDPGSGFGVAGVCCTVLFAAEILVRALSRGIHVYTHSTFDLFEIAILILSTIAQALWGWRGASLLVLRLLCLFRWSMWRPKGSLLYRVDKLVLGCTGFSLRTSLWHMMNQLRLSFRRAIALFMYTGNLLFLIQYFFSILGTMLIDNKLAAVNLIPGAPMAGEYGDMTNFGSTGAAMIAMYQVMLTNNWNDLLYTSMHATRVAIALFYIIYYILVPLLFLNIFTSIVLQSFQAESTAEVQAPGPIVVEMGGKVYRLERKGYRRGLELHMDLVDHTKQELMQDIINGGVFETTVMSGVEEQLMESAQAFAVLQLRHHKQKEIERRQQDFERAAADVSATFLSQRSDPDAARSRSGTVARDRGVRSQYGHHVEGAGAEEGGRERSCTFGKVVHPSAGGEGSGRERSSSLAVGMSVMDPIAMQELRAAHEALGWAQDVVDAQDLRRVFNGRARVHPSVLQAASSASLRGIQESEAGVEMTTILDPKRDRNSQQGVRWL